VVLTDGARHGATKARASTCAPAVDHDRLSKELGQLLAAVAIEELGEGDVRDLLTDTGALLRSEWQGRQERKQ
jgi:hypothetical protein